MNERVVGRLLLLGAILALPAAAFAQEATLTGAVTDSTGGVLPGVTVTAVLEATGNRFETVTDERGAFRMPVRVGIYNIAAELQGFATSTRTGLQLLAGQTATVNLQLAPSSVQETVTVTADSPLLDVATSSLGGNIDPQQVTEMPSEGRNWMALLMLAPGSRSRSANPSEPLETRNANRTREYQTNVDGMQFANTMGGGGQPAFSQEMIAEFQYISNRFDATQGRSSGVQVNMITKSGTNRFAGSFRGNFRDDRFNAENPVLHRVVPIKNQQLAGSIGGPIRRDRLHFFFFDEYERAPKTEIWNTPFPKFNVALDGTSTTPKLVATASPPSATLRCSGVPSQSSEWSNSSTARHPAAAISLNIRARSGRVPQLIVLYASRKVRLPSIAAILKVASQRKRACLCPPPPRSVNQPPVRVKLGSAFSSAPTRGVFTGNAHEALDVHVRVSET